MTYNDWLSSLEVLLKSNGSNLRVRDLDPNALKDAYDMGHSPALFARSTPLPLRKKGVKATTPKHSKAWLILPALLIPIAFTYRYLTMREREMTGWDNLMRRNKWPVALPLKTPNGPFTPEEASEPISRIYDKLREHLLNPKAAKFVSCDVVMTTSPGCYEYRGEVDAQNQFGATTRATFTASARRQVRVTYKQPGQPPEWTRIDKDWTIEVGDRLRSPESNVWNDAGTSTSEAKAVPAKKPSLAGDLDTSAIEITDIRLHWLLGKESGAEPVPILYVEWRNEGSKVVRRLDMEARLLDIQGRELRMLNTVRVFQAARLDTGIGPGQTFKPDERSAIRLPLIQGLVKVEARPKMVWWFGN